MLVYLHGGGFSAGDGSEPRHDGEPLAARQVVVVTVNYRLGVFGFLAHPELSAASAYAGSGNYGLLDQIAALAWVRDNIAQFGGDPDRVTIGGPSAGSEAVTGLMASPLARGLFAGAILSSGALMPPAPDVPWTEADRRVSTFLMQAYVSFIREGQPRVEMPWPPFAPDAWPVLHLDASPVVHSDPARQRYLFLESASPQLPP